MSISLDKITKNGKTVILAYDHGLEHGPVDFNEKNVDPEYILKIAAEADLNAVVLQKGVAEKYYVGSPYTKVPLIVKVNGKASLYKGEAYSPQVCSVPEAKKLGAAAVGYTIYLGSEYEWKMYQEFGRLVEEAHREGLIAIAWIYPRGKAVQDDTSPEITAYAARTALELEADIAKIKYCGNEESFKWAVKSAGRTKVVLSGGPKTDEPSEFLETLKSVMSAGAIGVAVGRNVWQAKDPLAVAAKVKEVVFSG